MQIIALPIIFALLGFITSSDQWLLFLNKLNPFQGLLIYYFIIFITIFILQHCGLIIGDHKMQSFQQSIGQVLIIFSFFIIFNFTNQYIQWVVDNKNETKSENCTGIFNQSEDGSVYYLINSRLQNPRLSRYVAFMAVPFVLSMIGIFLLTEKIEISLL